MLAVVVLVRSPKECGIGEGAKLLDGPSVCTPRERVRRKGDFWVRGRSGVIGVPSWLSSSS